MTSKQKFEQEFNNIPLLKMFEIEVVNNKTKDQDYVIFDISIQGRKFIAQHESLTTKQSKSKKISFVSLPIDYDFSLDMNLQNLYDSCIDAIIQSEFFTLAD